MFFLFSLVVYLFTFLPPQLTAESPKAKTVSTSPDVAGPKPDHGWPNAIVISN